MPRLAWPLEKLSAAELAPVADRLAELARSGIADMNWKRRKAALSQFYSLDNGQKIIISQKLTERYREFTGRETVWDVKELERLLELNKDGLLDFLCELIE